MMTDESFDLTRNESLTILIISLASATLSIAGSCAIIYKTSIQNRKKSLDDPYKRILFGMSVADIFQSTAHGLVAIPAPSDTPGAFFAYGNLTTCELQGFLACAGLGCMYYNVMLAWHYVLQIRYNMKNIQERKTWEPYMHGVAVGLPLTIATVFLFLDQYNYDGSKCWVAGYPYGCEIDDDVACTRGFAAYQLRLWCLGVPSLLFFFFVPTCVAVVFYTVREKEKKIQRRFVTSTTRRSLTQRNNSAMLTPTADGFDEDNFDVIELPQQPHASRDDVNNADDDARIRNASRRIMFSSQRRNSFSSQRRNSVSSVGRSSFSSLRRFSFSSSCLELSQDEHIAESMREELKMSRRTRALAKQSVFYVLAFSSSMLPAIITRCYENFTGYRSFSMILISQLLFPLQGLFNFFIYIRPQVLRIQRYVPSITLCAAIKMAMFEDEIEKSRRRLSKISQQMAKGSTAELVFSGDSVKNSKTPIDVGPKSKTPLGEDQNELDLTCPFEEAQRVSNGVAENINDKSFEIPVEVNIVEIHTGESFDDIDTDSLDYEMPAALKIEEFDVN